MSYSLSADNDQQASTPTFKFSGIQEREELKMQANSTFIEF